jgi:hypothetical protein
MHYSGILQRIRSAADVMTSTPGEFAAFLRADIKKLNPAGLVPVLVKGGQALTASYVAAGDTSREPVAD